MIEITKLPHDHPTIIAVHQRKGTDIVVIDVMWPQVWRDEVKSFFKPKYGGLRYVDNGSISPRSIDDAYEAWLAAQEWSSAGKQISWFARFFGGKSESASRKAISVERVNP